MHVPALAIERPRIPFFGGHNVVASVKGPAKLICVLVSMFPIKAKVVLRLIRGKVFSIVGIHRHLAIEV